jgi:hypothetical protein
MGTMQARTTGVQNAFGMGVLLLGRDPRLRQPVTAPGRQASMGTMQARATGAQSAFGMPALEGVVKTRISHSWKALINRTSYCACARNRNVFFRRPA